MELTSSQWCFNKRDELLAEGHVEDAMRYQDLGNMWKKREEG